MKKALKISISLNILIILFIVCKRYYYSHSSGSGASQGSFYDTWNNMRNSLLSDLPIDSTDIVFVGNSLTDAFPVTEIFGQHVKNRGIGGNQTQHILHRIQDIAKGQPKKIFLEVGINDLNSGVSVDSVYNNYKLIIKLICESSPGTSIHVQSVFPTRNEYAKLNALVVLLNEKLVSYCRTGGICFIDVYRELAVGGELNNAYTIDGIHLTGEGYRVWQKAVEPYLK